MEQVSRPMQVALVATLLLVAVWFLALKPKSNADVAATPVTVATPVAATTSGKTDSALDKTAYSQVAPARAAADAASADANKTASQTGESGATVDASTPASASATTPSKSSSAATGSSKTAATTPATAAATTPATATGAKSSAATPAVSGVQGRADKVILGIKNDLAHRKAVVLLVWSKTGAEDKILHKLISKKIDKRGGKVKTFFIPVGEVGRYDGLLAGLALGQTPSTIVIAPNNEAKVLGGLTSVARIDRLTSAAIQIKPTTATTK